MWPVLLDMTKEESIQRLRNLELEAYAQLVSALRAQGPLSPDKRRLLKDTGQALNIPPDRHKAEIRRAVNDERLNTIAYHVTGQGESQDDWAQEGRRTVPLLPRMAPQTAYSAMADEAADTAHQHNRQLPQPALTERKRLPQQQQQSSSPLVTEATLAVTAAATNFRVPDTPTKGEDGVGGAGGGATTTTAAAAAAATAVLKKRKLPPIENSSLAQHLLNPAKMSRPSPQQIYRQRAKNFINSNSKEIVMMKKQKLYPASSNGPKINIVQNITLQPPQQVSQHASGEETIEQIQQEINSYRHHDGGDGGRKLLPAPARTLPSLTFKQIQQQPGDSKNNVHGMKIISGGAASPASIKKNVVGQKLIMVSNAQTLQSSSILQKTLSIPLMKNISMKNFDKFKIVTTSSSATQHTLTASPINSLNLKHKVVTVKTNANSKKVIPFSLLNSKGGIKVLPIGGKIVGKTTATTSSNASNVLILNTIAKSMMPQSDGKENGDVKASPGVTTDDFDAQIEEFRIPNNHVIEAAMERDDEVPSSGDSNSQAIADANVVSGDGEVIEGEDDREVLVQNDSGSEVVLQQADVNEDISAIN